ncbi:MAG: 30S ribosomal protein S17 [Thermoprotei archaeon]|jgi:small subunit ribosomal protein S17
MVVRPGKKIFGIEPPPNTCNDPNCPYHGSIKVRGLIAEGIVIKTRTQKMVVVEREVINYVPKYMRYIKSRSRIHAHVPECMNVKEGDKVIIGETRPIAKTVSFVILKNLSAR